MCPHHLILASWGPLSDGNDKNDQPRQSHPAPQAVRIDDTHSRTLEADTGGGPTPLAAGWSQTRDPCHPWPAPAWAECCQGCGSCAALSTMSRSWQIHISPKSPYTRAHNRRIPSGKTCSEILQGVCSHHSSNREG